ncbi:hypothetical protein ZWY2020_057855 [Hordeum vulgare]|nr:hypothetical protein ZWY2020_057855 [Hordeum vulgare]
MVGLSFTKLGMGMTLTLDDLRTARFMPKELAAGFLLQYTALSLGFPLWVASACALALWRPASFLWVTPTAQMVGLSFTKLGMGMTLTLDDLRTARFMPKELAAGFLLQYTRIKEIVCAAELRLDTVSLCAGVFLEMWEGAGVQPNELTVSSVLPACAAVGAMELGMKVEEYARGKGHLRNVFVTNALLEMYAKCGSIQRAWQGTPSYAQFMYGDADSKFAPSVKGLQPLLISMTCTT